MKLHNLIIIFIILGILSVIYSFWISWGKSPQESYSHKVCSYLLNKNYEEYHFISNEQKIQKRKKDILLAKEFCL